MQNGLHRFSRGSLAWLREAAASEERNRKSLACEICESENLSNGRAVCGASRVAHESLAAGNIIRDDRPPGALSSVADLQGISIVERNTDWDSGIGTS